MKRYREADAAGITDLRRGKPNNYQLPRGLAEGAVKIIREHYVHFGPIPYQQQKCG